ncbi:UDP-glucosyltransferase 2-like [Choristoneura fumiferana]|uniref:UDP-glucosyltransferase 2-like n=1 Tax=Choristoneura fumiferana TaxID=7141 RepID=UPI003D156C03
MRALAFLTVAFSVSHYVHSARILGLFPHTGKSHQMVFEPLLRRLAERGHHVTTVSFFPLKNPPANYTDVSLEGIANIGVETMDLGFYEQPRPLIGYFGVERILKQVREFYPLADMALNVCRKLVNWPALTEALKKDYDLVLVENFNSDCMLGLVHVYGINAPTVALLSSGMMPWSPERVGVSDNPSYVATLSTNLLDRMTFVERLENTFVQLYFKWWYRYDIQLKEQEVLEKHFGRKITDLSDLARNTSLFLLNTFFALNGVKPLLPGVVEVGGMHLDPNRKTIPPHIEKFLNESAEGVVLFSFGSLIKTASIPKYREEIIVTALSKLKQRVIWKYEDSGEDGTIIGNIMRVRWIPQLELLNHRKVVAFIAHGGLLGMTEAISAGKPMLVVPFFGDQPQNAATAEAAGLAKVLNYAELTEQSLLEGLRSVLSAEMRLSARRASKIWHDRQTNPLDTAVYWVERVLRWGPQSPLHSGSKHLSFHEYTLLDVAATLLAALILVILIIHYFIFTLIPRSLSFSGKKKIH